MCQPLLRLFASVLIAMLAQGCLERDRVAVPDQGLRIATGGTGGVYYAYGEGLAAVVEAGLPGAQADVVATAASVDNLQRISDGRADLAFSLADAAALAVLGDAPFAQPLPVMALARIYDNYTHLVVRADSDIDDITDLRGRTVSTGAAGSGTELIADRLLEVAGVDARDLAGRQSLGIDESAAGLRDGELDAFFWSGGLPTAAVARLAGEARIELVDLSTLVAPMRSRYGEFYSERSVPASTYDLSSSVATIGVPNYLLVNKDMGDDLAHALTRLLFDEEDRLAEAHPEAGRVTRRAAITTFPVPLHPGAIRYYREAKA